MKLWRISNYDDLSGHGGVISDGRWHNRGIPVVYLAESPSLAMLEVLVNFEMDPAEVPDTYQLLQIEYSSERGISNLDVSALDEGWRKNKDLTQTIGDGWLTDMSSALLEVPSAILPHSSNYLFNPRHPLASNAKVVSVHKHPYDKRLF